MLILKRSFCKPQSTTRLWSGAIALLGALAVAATAQGTPDRLNVPAPELMGDRWLNAEAKEIPSLRRTRGTVTVLHFWTFG